MKCKEKRMQIVLSFIVIEQIETKLIILLLN